MTLDKQIDKILDGVFFSSIRIPDAKAALKRLIKEAGEEVIGENHKYPREQYRRNRNNLREEQRAKLKELLK